MARYVWAARVSIVLLGGVLIVTTSRPGQRFLRALDVRHASDSILYGADSPFHTLNGTYEEPLRTNIIVQSPVNPFSNPADDNEEATHTVAKGSTLTSLWGAIKGAPKAAADFAKAFTKHGKSNASLRAGEVLEVRRKDGEVVEVRRSLNFGDTMVIEGHPDSGYTSRIEKARINIRERRASGTIYSSLTDSASNASVPYDVVDDFVDLLGERVEFNKDLQPGDTFTISYDEKVTEDGQIIDVGSIKSASLVIRGKMYAVVRDVGKGGTVRYFNEKGEIPTKGFLRYPVKYTRISSMFSNARFHPVLKVKRPHHGVDFSAPTGTPVRSVGEGTVVFAGYSASGGNMVRIAHGSRYTTEYMHLSRITKGLRKGSHTDRGSVIGAVGSTGLSSGPHLHYALFDKGKYVDPMRAKISSDPGPIKAPPAVMAALDAMKKEHESVALSAPERKRKA
jgi:murein DD-endopeptidase MepM/ murein hydrolase activator NlpD